MTKKSHLSQNDQMEMKTNTVWAAVTIVFILVTGAVVLVSLGKDVTVILSLAGLVAVPVLSAFGVAVYQKLEAVKEASNGNLSRVIEMQQETQKQLTALAMVMPSVTAEMAASATAGAITEKDITAKREEALYTP